MTRGAWHRREEAIMGTAVHVELWGEDASLAQDAMSAVMTAMRHVDEVMSPFKPESELSRINRDAAEKAVPVSAELFGLLERALDFSRLSDGAFDITYASVGHLFDYRSRVRPREDEWEHARAAVGYRNLLLERSSCSVRFARPGVRIDLGGFAKGYAVDLGADVLRARGFRHAIVTAGGDSRIVGDRRGRPWSIGVRDPRRPGELAAVLPLADVAISTSGDYERFFEDGGVRYHHILDPRTGLSPSAVRSVTTIAPDGLTSEGMSKIVFVLGIDAGMRVVESQANVDAVVVDASGTLHYSSGFLPGKPPFQPAGQQT